MKDKEGLNSVEGRMEYGIRIKSMAERGERFEVIMYDQVYRCFKTTGIDFSVCTILSGLTVLVYRFQNLTNLLCLGLMWIVYYMYTQKSTTCIASGSGSVLCKGQLFELSERLVKNFTSSIYLACET